MLPRFAIFPALIALLASTAPAAPVKVFLLAGQSNMYGAGETGYMPVELRTPQSDVLYQRLLLSQSGGTDAATTSWGNLTMAPTGYGPEVTFGRAIADALTADVAIIKVAQNGSGLEAHWMPTETRSNAVWPPFTGFVADALDQLTALGHTPEIAGFVWVQGTTDAQQAQYAEDYAANMATFATALRALYGSTLPIVMSQEHAGSSAALWPFVGEVRTQKSAWVASDPYASLVSIDDMPLKADLTHYRGDTQVELGYRLAEAWLALVPEPSTLLLLGVTCGSLSLRRR